MGFKLVRVDATEACKIPLPVGTHLIGRGKFLECNDHRVSRMHGQLKVTDDAVTITALHQNPCFFRKKDVTSIHVLPLNNSIDLNNGDQFGLIPDSFWFEVIYCIDNVQGPGTVVTPFTRVVKQGESTLLNSSGSSETTARSSISQDTISMESQETITPGPYQYPSPSKRAHSEIQPYSIKKPKIEDSSPTREENRPNELDSPSILNQNENSLQNYQNIPENVQNQSENDQSSSECTQPISNNDQISSENTEPISSNDQNLLENVLLSSNIVPKKEPRNDDDTESSSNENKPIVKQEPNSPTNVKAGPSQDQQVNRRPAADGGGPAAPGAAPQGNNDKPREKCMYAERCYRVNPVHKAQFSHPGDADWAARRECARGAACRHPRAAHPRDNYHPVPQPRAPHGDYNNAPGVRVVQRHGNIFYINAHSVNFYDDHFEVQDSDGESVDYDYEF